MKTSAELEIDFQASMQLACRYFRSILNVKKIKFQVLMLYPSIRFFPALCYNHCSIAVNDKLSKENSYAWSIDHRYGR
jgi:hypothetical protein